MPIYLLFYKFRIVTGKLIQKNKSIKKYFFRYSKFGYFLHILPLEMNNRRSSHVFGSVGTFIYPSTCGIG